MLAGGLAIAAVLALTFVAQREQTTLQAVELTRVTSDSGLTLYPALSRDGKCLRTSDRAGGILNIWLQPVGTGEPVRYQRTGRRYRIVFSGRDADCIPV